MTTNATSGDPGHPTVGIRDLITATWILVALGTVLGDPDHRPTASDTEPGTNASSPAPQVAAAIDLLLELGLLERADMSFAWSQEMKEFVGREGADVSLAHIRTTLLQAGAAISGRLGGRDGADWTSDAEVVRSQGRRSRQIVQFMIDSLSLLDPDIQGRLSSAGALFLDAGAGAGDISIEMATNFPTLHVVALEPADTALRVLREHVDRSGLGSRLQVRRGRLEELSDNALYTLAWVPLDFISTDVVETALLRTCDALVAGGWLAIATPSSQSSPAAAVARFRSALWSGSDLNGTQLIRLLEGLGFVSVHVLPYASSIDVVVCRRR